MDPPDQIEQLFLLEVLVDKVVLNNLPPETPIRLRVKFIEFPCFEITQQDFKKDDEPITEGNFNSGKSFLFPMVPLDLIRNLQRHPLAVTVFQIKEDAPLLPEIIGQTRVRMSEGMSEAVHSAMSCHCDNDLPISHTLTDTFSLRNIGEEVGTIALFIRLSCFGQSIVTQFQLMGEKKAFLFKNSKADNSFQCKKPAKEHAKLEDPTMYDILPVAPFITTEETCFDFYAPSPGEAPKYDVAWKAPLPKPAPCPTCDARPGCNPTPPCPPVTPCPYKAPVNPCRQCGANQPTTRAKPQASSTGVQKNPCTTCGTAKPKVPVVQTNPCGTCGMIQPTADDPNRRNSANMGSTGSPAKSRSQSLDSKSLSSGTEPVNNNPCSVCGAVCPGRPSPPKPVVCEAPSSCGTALEFIDSEDSTPSAEQPFICAFCGTTNPPRKEASVCATCGTTLPPDKGTNTCCVCGTDGPFIKKPKECSVCGFACPGNDKLWIACDPCPPDNVCPECGEDLPTEICPTPCPCPCGDGLDEAPPPPPNPPVRYDTTGALSPAFMGWPEKEPEPLLPSPYCRCGMEEGDAGISSPRHSLGQGDGRPSSSQNFNTSPVRQTGSTPDVMQSFSQEPCLTGVITTRNASHSEGDLGGQPAAEVSAGTLSGGGRKRRKKRSKWTHKWGLQYPGIKVGHRFCVESSRQVPPHMGWLWNNPSVGHKYRKGWRPGALTYAVSKMIDDHRMRAGQPPLGSKSKSKSKFKSGHGKGRGGNDGPQPPTLHIHRREGAYYISMHPLDLGPDAVNVPLQFKIPKREREEGDDASTSSSEESELEIEFMAPGAFEVKEPPPEFKSHGTQYCDEDHTPKVKVGSQLHLTKKGNKGGSKTAVKVGKKGKITIKTPEPGIKVDPRVLEMLKNVQHTPFGRKPTGFVRGLPPLQDDDDDDAIKGVAWDAHDTPTAVGKVRLKK